MVGHKVASMVRCRHEATDRPEAICNSTVAVIPSRPSSSSDESTLFETTKSNTQSEFKGYPLPLNAVQTATKDPKNDLWTRAYERLRATNPELLASFEAIIVSDSDESTSLGERLSVVVAQKRDEMLSRQWTVKFMNHKLKIREQLQRVAKVAEYARGFGSIIANIDPVHAGLPWAGINLLLTVRYFSNIRRSDAT